MFIRLSVSSHPNADAGSIRQPVFAAGAFCTGMGSGTGLPPTRLVSRCHPRTTRRQPAAPAGAMFRGSVLSVAAAASFRAGRWRRSAGQACRRARSSGLKGIGFRSLASQRRVTTRASAITSFDADKIVSLVTRLVVPTRSASILTLTRRS
jgi:hypothetical protein